MATPEDHRAGVPSQVGDVQQDPTRHQRHEPVRSSGPHPPTASRHTAPSAASSVPEPISPAERHDIPAGSVVAGIDHSATARTAARWAADEADRRHTSLALVHAFRITARGYPDYNTIPDNLDEALRTDGNDLLHAVAEEVRAGHPDLHIQTSLVHDRAAQALRAASQHAQLTVVGSHDASRIAAVLVGSVAYELASTNPMPLAVIHPDHADRAGGAVVVGVDGSPVSDAAVGFAFDEAALRGAELLAVHAWNDVYLDGWRLQPPLVDPHRLEIEERALLSQRLAGWRDKYPDVQVSHAVLPQRPTPVLLRYSATAQLLVVGSHGRGGFAGMLLGSTSHALIQHATCPVVVVRPDPSRG